MTLDIPGLRPAVISVDLKEALESFRGFRHVVRNVYAQYLRPEKMAPLVENLGKVFGIAENEIKAFALFLKGADIQDQ